MGFRSVLSKPFASIIAREQKKWSSSPIETQNKVFSKIIRKAEQTLFGKDHDFSAVNTYEEFKDRVRVQDYEGLRPYVDKVVA